MYVTVFAGKLWTVGARNRWRSWGPLLLAVLASFCGPRAQAQPTRTLPHDQHFFSFRPYLEGDFTSARREFLSTPRLKSTEGVSIDSVAFHTMVGECMYHMGDLAGALKQYTTALQVYLQDSEWLLRIRVPDTLQPSKRAARRTPTWGVSTRAVRVADIPDRIGIRMGRTDESNLQALRQGGVLSSPYMALVNAKEIVRCMALAIRRRAEILGPAGEYDALNNELVTALSRRPAPPNSWLQAWISTHLGLAYAAKGKSSEAIEELKKSLLAGGMDHNLTPTALLELGKLAFRAAEYATAGTCFLEATYSAALLADDDFTQYEVLAEAFRWGMITNLITNKGTYYQPLAVAVDWSRNGHRIVEASLLLSAAENFAAINDPVHARPHLDRIMQVLRRRECSKGELGARYQFVSAQTSFLAGDAKQGATALASALAYQRGASRRLFQIAMADSLFTGGGITTRQAGLLYEIVLRDPTPQDWAIDPLESLSVLTIPHPVPYENWMLLTLDRKENDIALRISEALRRHRFYGTLPLGGRILNLRWTLEAPVEQLPQTVVLQRQDLLNRHPAYAELSRRAAQLRAELTALPLQAEDAEMEQKLNDLQSQLSEVGASMERILEVMALSREPNEVVFPPSTDVTRVQEQLAPEQRVLVYTSARGATFAFLLGPDKYSAWHIEEPAQIKKDLVEMLRAMGLVDRNLPLALKDLTSSAWKDVAGTVLQELTADAPADAWNEFEELIIVPDGLLWYVPFEMLQVRDGDEHVALIDKVRVRYVPTISLAVPDKRARQRAIRTGVVTGRLFPRDDETRSTEFLAELRADDAQVFGIAVKPPPKSPLLAKLIDCLVVLDDLDNDAKGPYDWSPLPIDRGRSAGNLAEWMKLPWGGPDQLVLPGFHTPAENALKRAGRGDELFLTACGLMATGSRTLLLSRWRDGGRTSYDLVREFVRELPYRSASEAWQRSVRLAVEADLALDREPRVKEVPPDTSQMKADHPFFWGGYMLIDTGVQPE